MDRVDDAVNDDAGLLAGLHEFVEVRCAGAVDLDAEEAALLGEFEPLAGACPFEPTMPYFTAFLSFGFFSSANAEGRGRSSRRR